MIPFQMNKIFLLLGLLSVTSFISGQTPIDSLIRQGIKYHDSRAYQMAIDQYQKALEIDPNSEVAIYEISISMVEMGDYYGAIEYSDKLIKRNDKYAILSYNTKGSSLNYLGKTDEAIDVFLEGIDLYPDFDLLHYNLGLAYHTKMEYEKAKDAFIAALDINPQHSGAHLNLGRTMMRLNKRVESLLSLYFFLLLEPNSERSEWAYNGLHLQLSDSSHHQGDSDIADILEVDKMISELAASNIEEGKNSETNSHIFIKTTYSIFSTLGKLKDKHNNTGFWWEFYVPFFSSLTSAGYTEPFCHYISHAFQRESDYFINNNPAKVNSFSTWLQQR